MLNYIAILKINGIYNEVYGSENIELPITVKDTLDKSYATASVRLLLLDVPVEYQAGTECTLQFIEVDNSGATISSGSVASNYYMIIEQDKVDEVYIGDKTKYNHSLTLIEATKQLENEMMPNISMTQPTQRFSGTVSLIKPEINLGNMIWPDWASEKPNEGETVSEMLKRLASKKEMTAFIENSFDASVKNKRTNKLAPGDPLKIEPLYLEINSTMAIMPKVIDIFLVGGLIGVIIVSANLIKQVKNQRTFTTELLPYSVVLTNGTDSYECVGTTATRYDRYDIPNSTIYGFYLKIKSTGATGSIVVPSNVPAGTYDLVYKYRVDKAYSELGVVSKVIDNFPVNNIITSTYKNVTIGDISSVEPYTLADFLDRLENEINVNDEKLLVTEDPTFKTGAYYFPSDEGVLTERENARYTDYITLETGVNRTYTLTISKPTGVSASIGTTYIAFYDKNKKTVYSTISKKNIIKSSIPDDAKYMTISRLPGEDNTLAGQVSIKIYGSAKPKYTFDLNIKSLAQGISCPEFTFDKKSLWEICLEIGELFNGIPFLREGNVIDYTILKEEKAKSITLLPSSTEKTANLQNYATKLYTPELKNIIQDDNPYVPKYTAYYPSKDGWVKPRGIDYNTTTLDRKKVGIVIEGENSKIYKIKKVQCRYKKGNNYNVADITRYVVEESIYNTLSSTVNLSLFGTETSEKGKYLYYKRGDNIIYNIGSLPDNASLIGWKQKANTIQFILASINSEFNTGGDTDVTNSYSKDIFDYEFNIEYLPYESQLSVARKSNLNNIYKQMTLNFNQSSTNISSSAFARHSENTLSKMGNPEYNTSYTTSSMTDDIGLGDKVYIDNRLYYVNTITNQYNNVDRTVNLNLTKDNYKQNVRVAVSKEYRPYNIDSNNTIRKTLTKPYISLISTSEILVSSDSEYASEAYNYAKNTFINSILDTFVKNAVDVDKITSAYITPLESDDTRLIYGKYDDRNIQCSNMVLPVMTTNIGNTISFTWDMYDNFSAGRKLTEPDDDAKDWAASLADSIEDKLGIKIGDYGMKFQYDARYVDDDGYTPKITSIMCSPKDTVSLDSFTYPEISKVPSKTNFTNYIENTFYAYKDSREKLSFQVSMSYQTIDKDIDIYQGLTNYNRLISSGNDEAPSWYGYTSDNAPDNTDYYDFNTDYKLTYDIEKPYEINKASRLPYIKLNLKNATTTDFDGYVCCYPDGEILVNIMKNLNLGKNAFVYFTLFNDEIPLEDTFTGYQNLNVTDKNKLKEFVPILKKNGESLLIDNLPDYFDQAKICVELVLKHNTYPRKFKHGVRKYQNKSILDTTSPKESLYHTMNNYDVGNKNITEFRIDIDGSIYYYDENNTKKNLYEYLINRPISRNNFGSKKSKMTMKHTLLYYHIILKNNETFSKRSSNSAKAIFSKAKLALDENNKVYVADALPVSISVS